MPNTNKLDPNESHLSNLLKKLSYANSVPFNNDQTTTPSDNNDSNEENLINISEYRSKLKTIKIFIASNKNGNNI